MMEPHVAQAMQETYEADKARGGRTVSEWAIEWKLSWPKTRRRMVQLLYQGLARKLGTYPTRHGGPGYSLYALLAPVNRLSSFPNDIFTQTAAMHFWGITSNSAGDKISRWIRRGIIEKVGYAPIKCASDGSGRCMLYRFTPAQPARKKK